MSHHSSQEFKPDFDASFMDEVTNSKLNNKTAELISNAMNSNRHDLGSTGKFPQGSLTKNDEGEIKLGVTNYKGKVILNLGKPVAWIGFNADQAREIAKILTVHADKINPS